jgi:hypothetical protein
MHLPHEIRYKNVQPCCAFKLAQCSHTNYLLQRNMAIGVAVLLPFLGVSSLNSGPLLSGLFSGLVQARSSFTMRTDEPRETSHG